MEEINCKDHQELMRKMKPQWREKIIELSGSPNIQGLEISGMIRRLANFYDAIFNLDINGAELTGPRLGILIRLYIDEQLGRTEGISPTSLSHVQNVSKNTISSLVRGLEDQGLVKRENDPDDHRIYRLQLTNTGRQLIVEQAPKHIAYLNTMTSDLTSEELAQLLQLLEKLLASLLANSNFIKTKMQSS